jgi:hypothetical protein
MDNNKNMKKIISNIIKQQNILLLKQIAFDYNRDPNELIDKYVVDYYFQENDKLNNYSSKKD